MGAPMVFFEIAGPDGKELQDFYAAALDWKIDPLEGSQFRLHRYGRGRRGQGRSTELSSLEASWCCLRRKGRVSSPSPSSGIPRAT